MSPQEINRHSELLHRAMETPPEVPVQLIANPYGVENPFQPLAQEQVPEIQNNMVMDTVSRNLAQLVMGLERHIDTDELTGAGSLVAAKNEIQRLIDGGKGLDLYFLDFNNFKKVNDEVGHEAGDKTLITMVSALIGNLREGERIFRVGGDEFVITKDLSVKKDRRQSQKEDIEVDKRDTNTRRADIDDDSEGLKTRVGGALEQSLEALEQIMGKELSLKMGISVGHARHKPGQTIDDLWKAADIDMYEDKRASKLAEVEGQTPEEFHQSRLRRIIKYVRQSKNKTA